MRRKLFVLTTTDCPLPLYFFRETAMRNALDLMLRKSVPVSISYVETEDDMPLQSSIEEDVKEWADSHFLDDPYQGVDSLFACKEALMRSLECCLCGEPEKVSLSC